MGQKEIDELKRIWQDFVDRQKKDKFILNSNQQTVERLARGVLDNAENHGLKFCPCRMTTGDIEDDVRLICPCNFKIQNAWKEKQECWCSLFVKEQS